uniref:Uncharacterized protein n=1 Tax=Rhizophagus irregularis (strain DAOM 181602 / DAOM 197198 / MUCL 43194) TaxID=747089 RepID=U9UBL2_RHIID
MAMHNLGLLYIRGGDDKDYRKAFELCKRSAEEGYLKGITTLGYWNLELMLISKRQLN